MTKYKIMHRETVLGEMFTDKQGTVIQITWKSLSMSCCLNKKLEDVKVFIKERYNNLISLN